MAKAGLHNCRILVVEDEYLIAEDLCETLADAGAIVVGPAASLDRAVELVGGSARIDGAILDVNLRGELAWPAADLLAQRQVPVVFTTGYDGAMVPERFGAMPRFDKPADFARILQALESLLPA
jgi:CheY-like chemotaxis protein